MKNLWLGVSFAAALFAGLPIAGAQEEAPQEDTNKAETIVSGWVTRCAAAERNTKSDCSVERSIALQQTGQLLAKLTIQVPGKTLQPALVLQTPHGIFLPAGIDLQTDDGEVKRLVLNTCDANGCYAATDLTPGALDEMVKGANLKISFQNLAKSTIAVSVPLKGFTAAYNKVK